MAPSNPNAGYSARLHPARNALRTAFFADASTVALLTPIVWVLHKLGALS